MNCGNPVRQGSNSPKTWTQISPQKHPSLHLTSVMQVVLELPFLAFGGLLVQPRVLQSGCSLFWAHFFFDASFSGFFPEGHVKQNHYSYLPESFEATHLFFQNGAFIILLAMWIKRDSLKCLERYQIHQVSQVTMNQTLVMHFVAKGQPKKKHWTFSDRITLLQGVGNYLMQISGDWCSPVFFF